MGTTVKSGARASGANSLKERQREQRAALILQAAYDELLAKGYHEVSMDEIAARAGISKGALYLHFAGKEALIVALLEQEIAAYLALIEAVANDQSSVRSRLERILLQTYTSIGSRHHFLFMLRAIGGSKSAIWARLQKQLPLAELTDRLTRLFEEGQQSGELDGTIPTSIMVALFLSLMQTYAEEHLEESQPLSPEAFTALVSRVLFQGLSAPLSGER
jgi:AcrR family transcriptional regulator